jgi:hypothetical protein
MALGELDREFDARGVVEIKNAVRTLLPDVGIISSSQSGFILVLTWLDLSLPDPHISVSPLHRGSGFGLHPSELRAVANQLESLTKPNLLLQQDLESGERGGVLLIECNLSPGLVGERCIQGLDLGEREPLLLSCALIGNLDGLLSGNLCNRPNNKAVPGGACARNGRLRMDS